MEKIEKNSILDRMITGIPQRKRSSFIYKIKNTLVKDLACRLPYDNTMLQIYDKESNVWNKVKLNHSIWNDIYNSNIGILHVKVYLRPVSSLTNKEVEEIFNEVLKSEEDASEYGDWIKFRADGGIEFIFNRRSYKDVMKLYDWMYRHNIDLNNLAEYNLTFEWPPSSKDKDNENYY